MVSELFKDLSVEAANIFQAKSKRFFKYPAERLFTKINIACLNPVGANGNFCIKNSALQAKKTDLKLNVCLNCISVKNKELF